MDNMTEKRNLENNKCPLLAGHGVAWSLARQIRVTCDGFWEGTGYELDGSICSRKCQKPLPGPSCASATESAGLSLVLP